LIRSRLLTRLAIPRARFIHSSTARLNVNTTTTGPSQSPLVKQKEPFSRRFFYGVGITTVFTLLAGSGLVYYYTQTEGRPGEQPPFDPSKKTLVVLGSGWGATSLLNKLDTENYNVVRLFCTAFRGLPRARLLTQGHPSFSARLFRSSFLPRTFSSSRPFCLV
jgi:hypothetical protein